MIDSNNNGIFGNLQPFIFALVWAVACSSCGKDDEGKKSDDADFYESVTIGQQTWMTQNLGVVKYRNGDPITPVADSLEWQNANKGAYCNYNNDTSLVKTYGRIYNWYAVNDGRKLAPKGWHIPTHGEWQALISQLGGLDAAGGKLKEMGLDHWMAPNTDASNETGFTALPGGFRSETDGSYSSMGGYGVWWLASSASDQYASSMALSAITGIAYSNENKKNFGAYVRCIKDN